MQSLWREEQCIPPEKWEHGFRGSSIDAKVAERCGVNFLTTSILEIVKTAIGDTKQSKSLIAKPRIWNNLLSSQPLAFNLCGELVGDLGLATQLFRRFSFGKSIEKIEDIRFEYSPGRRNPKYLGDGTAFDIFIPYKATTGAKGFIAIEVKYAESRVAGGSYSERYGEIAAQMGIFKDEWLKRLCYSSLQQIWRDHLLSGSLIINGDYQEGVFVLLYPKSNSSLDSLAEEYWSALKPEIELFPFSVCELEEFYCELASVCSAPWVSSFFARYLDFAGRLGSLI
ncbi:MAG: hypothetical protein GX992_09390 [Clostridium sp.]|nr:hypothetical protein [Clostridium sp.]